MTAAVQGDLLDLLAETEAPADPVWRCPACHAVEPNELQLGTNHNAEVAEDGTITRGAASFWDDGMCLAMELTRNHVLYDIWKLERTRKVEWCRDKKERKERVEDEHALVRDVEWARDVWGNIRFWPGMLSDNDRIATGLDVLHRIPGFSLEVLLMPDWDHRLIERYSERGQRAEYTYRLSRKRGFIWRFWDAPNKVPELAVSWEEITAATAGDPHLPMIREWAETTTQRTDWSRPYQLQLPTPEQDRLDADWNRPGRDARFHAWTWTGNVYEAAIKRVQARDEPPF